MSQKKKKGFQDADELERLDKYITNLQEQKRMSKHKKKANMHLCVKASQSNEGGECFSELYEDEFSEHQLRWGS